MKRIRGEPQIQLEVEERKLIDRLQNKASLVNEFMFRLRKGFTRGEFADGEWTYQDLPTNIWSRTLLLREIRKSRANTQQIIVMLDELRDRIKDS